MITIAKGVTFEEDVHKYWYRGKELSGITGIIGKRVAGYDMPTGRPEPPMLKDARLEGSATHHAIQQWIESGFTVWKSENPDAIWLRDVITGWKYKDIQSETLVSDFKTYASAIDIIGVKKDMSLDLYDIKRKFNRDYVEFQLNIYRYFVEKYSKFKVNNMFCISVKDRRTYEMDYIEEKRLKRILYGKY